MSQTTPMANVCQSANMEKVTIIMHQHKLTEDNKWKYEITEVPKSMMEARHSENSSRTSLSISP